MNVPNCIVGFGLVLWNGGCRRIDFCIVQHMWLYYISFTFSIFHWNRFTVQLKWRGSKHVFVAYFVGSHWPICSSCSVLQFSKYGTKPGHEMKSFFFFLLGVTNAKQCGHFHRLPKIWAADILWLIQVYHLHGFRLMDDVNLKEHMHVSAILIW